MDTQQPPRLSRRPRVPDFRFRVLIIGRANAGKTTILQRVCETTDSPLFYRIFQGKEKVKLHPSIDRGEHTIDDELVFSNHKGYIFHDSRGIESGSTDELEILQKFIRRMCGQQRLKDRLHAIWYCVPMDNQRPQLDLKFFKDICVDENVPVIVVFTKYDQFRRNVQIHLEDFGSPDDNISDAAEKHFEEHYLGPLGDGVRFVRLEQMQRENMRCDKLIEMTAATLNDDIVALMLLVVQRYNLEISVTTALHFVHSRAGSLREVKAKVEECLTSFPYIWFREPEFDPRMSTTAVQRLLPHVMSLPTVRNFTRKSLNDHHLICAVILIFKHATFLRLEGLSPASALTQAELDYREANIDLKIRQHLTGSSQDSVEQSASFLMATDIEPSQSSVEAHVHGKEHWLKHLLKPAFPRKS